MLLVAFKNLLQDKSRILISLGGVTFSIVLMLIMLGIYRGTLNQFTLFIDNTPTDLVVVKKGIRDFFYGTSVIPESAVTQIEKEPEVKDAVPLITQRDTISVEPKQYQLIIAGYELGKPQGAPWKMMDGQQPAGPNEIVISNSLARKMGLKVGDLIPLTKGNFKVVGLADEAVSFGTYYAWVPIAEMQKLYDFPGTVSYIFVSLKNPQSAEAMRNVLQKKYPELTTFEKSEFVTNSRAKVDESFSQVLGAVLMLSIITGIALIGMTIYSTTVDKVREYGVLKALGATNQQLYGLVLIQSLVITGLGVAIGIGVSFALASFLHEYIDIPPELNGDLVGWVVAIGLGMAVLASFIPVRRIISIDPVEVFKS